MMRSLELEQLLVDAAAVIEDLTDDLDEDGNGARELAGRLRDAAAALRTVALRDEQNVFLNQPRGDRARGDME